MKAQALMELGDMYPAVHTAELSVAAKPLWWVSWQTLGRTQVNIGELKTAIISFQKAIHIKPDVPDLWDDDLKWARKQWLELSKKKDMNHAELSFHIRERMRIGIN